MVKKKRQSKRIPAAKRYKIEKKVREHRRKQRKDAKNNKAKKDPGIPNLFPFKEQVLKQIQERKERDEETRQRQKEQRHKEHAKRRSLQSFQNDIAKRTKQYEKKETLRKSIESDYKSDLLTKGYYKEFRKVVDAADVILEVLDARDPLGCRCMKIEQTVLSSGSNKRLILVLNKIDLVPRDNVQKWLKYLRNEFPTVAFKASIQNQKHNLSFQLGDDESYEKSSVCLGSEMLMKLLGNYCCNAGIKTLITVGVVGFPNVGKSSIINSLKRSRVCSVGFTPGITKSLQEIQLDKFVKLLDCPGIVLASRDDPTVALRNCVKLESLSDVMTPVDAILSRCDSRDVMLYYTIPDYSNTEDFLSHLAKRLGKLKKGGIPNIHAAALKVLHDWNIGLIKFYTHPPEQHKLPAHFSAEIVKEFGEAFDIDGVKEEEEKMLAGLMEKMDTALVLRASNPVQNMNVDVNKEEIDENSSDEIIEEMESEDEIDSDNDIQEEEKSNTIVCLEKKLTKRKHKTTKDNQFNQFY